MRVSVRADPLAGPVDGVSRGAQANVDAYFDSVACWWRDVYEAPTAEGAIYRRRRRRVLEWIDDLGLEASSVLEVGAGAGIVATDLVAAGHRVLAVDSSEEMVSLLRARAAATGVDDRLATAVADVQALDLPDASYDLVVAVGVLPWLPAPEAALAEMARVVRSDGVVILTSDNAMRLNHVLDVRFHPRLLPLLRALRRRLAARGLVGPGNSSDLVRMYRRRELLALLDAAGLRVERIASAGFGPFTLAGRRVLSERRAVALDERIQRLADRGVPGLRLGGSHHLVLARPS